MFKLVNTIVFATIALASVAHAQTTVTGASATGRTVTFTKSQDTQQADVAKAGSNYVKDRKEYAVDMAALHKADFEGVLEQRPIMSMQQREQSQAKNDARYKQLHVNEVMFNTARAPESLLRDDGIAHDMRESAIPSNYWVFTDRTPKNFVALYGEPAYSVDLEIGLCIPDYPGESQSAFYKAERAMGTYLDIDKEGHNVEIHVKTCRLLEGPFKGRELIHSITPVMQPVSFPKRFADNEKRVLQNRR